MTSELRCEETAKSWPCDVPGRGNSKFKGLVEVRFPEAEPETAGTGVNAVS